MTRTIDLTEFPGHTTAFRNAVQAASWQLKAEDHKEDCPVFHHASADCVWPLAICVPDDFLENIDKYLLLHEQATTGRQVY